MSIGSKYVVGERLRTAVVGKSLTKQSFNKECEINNIVAKHQVTGAVSHVNQYGGEYGFATSLDFAESMRIVVQAQDMFDDLPSSIRNKFANDPALFLDFVQDDENVEEMREMGLVAAEEVVEPIEVVVKEESVKAPEAAQGAVKVE